MKRTNISTGEITRIEKESVSELYFPSSEVLENRSLIKDRMFALHRATSLGNIHQRKVVLVFEDKDGLKSVKTTIWAISDRKVILKEGRSIPVQRVHSVKIAD